MTTPVKGVGAEPRVLPDGGHIRIPDPTSKDGKGAMFYPNPEATREIEHALRYGPGLTREQQLLAASALAAYRYLTIDPLLTQKERNARCKAIRTALQLQKDTKDKEGSE